MDDEEFFSPEEAEQRTDIMLRAVVGRTDFTDEEREILADIRRRNERARA